MKIRLGAGGCGLGSLTGAKADERQVLLPILDDTGLAALLPGQTLIGDKSYYGRDFEAALSQAVLHTCCARRARVSPKGPARSSSGRCARPSSQSMTPSKASSTWNATAGTPQPG